MMGMNLLWPWYRMVWPDITKLSESLSIWYIHVTNQTWTQQLVSDDSLYIFTECLIFARISVILEMNGKHEQVIAFSVSHIIYLIYFIRTFNATTRLIKFKMCEKLLYVLLLIAILQVWEEVFIWPYPLFQIMYILNTNHVQILQVLPSISSYW